MPGKPKALIIGINSILGRAVSDLLMGDYELTGVFHRNKENLPENISLCPVAELSTLSKFKFEQIYLIAAYVPDGNDSGIDEK